MGKETVEQFLDKQDLYRMEWQRIMEDLYPETSKGGRSSGPKVSRVHDDEEPIQTWLGEERSEEDG